MIKLLYILDNKTDEIKPFTGSVQKNNNTDKFLITKMDNKNICGHVVGTDNNYNLVFKVE